MAQLASDSGIHPHKQTWPPKKWWVEEEFPLGMASFLEGLCQTYRSGYSLANEKVRINDQWWHIWRHDLCIHELTLDNEDWQTCPMLLTISLQYVRLLECNHHWNINFWASLVFWWHFYTWPAGWVDFWVGVPFFRDFVTLCDFFSETSSLVWNKLDTGIIGDHLYN